MTRRTDTLRRTETTPALLHLGGGDQERVTAPLAGSLHSPGGFPTHEHSGFVGTDAATGPVVLAAPVCVARATARNQVGRVVIRGVPVQMISDQRIRVVRMPRLPVDRYPAPVARVRTGTDLVPQDQTSHSHLTRRGRDWVPLCGAHSVRYGVLSGLAKACVVAGLRAVRAAPFGGSLRQGLSAVCAGGFHVTHSSSPQERV